MEPLHQSIKSHPYHVRFLDLRVLDQEVKQELLAAVDAVLSHGQLVLGPEVYALEEKIAKVSQMAHAVGVNSAVGSGGAVGELSSGGGLSGTSPPGNVGDMPGSV